MLFPAHVQAIALHGLADSIGAGEDGCAVMPRRRGATDALELVVHRSWAMPERSASEIRRATASDCEAVQPPDFPICTKTSHRPLTSSLTVT